MKISASENSSMMYIPLSVIAKREEEMIKRALDLGVDSHQWTGSLLFRVAREKVHQYSNSQQKVNQNDLFLIELFPEYDCAEANYSQNFQWQMWLSHCIESFYKHGEMRIVDDCIGFEILVALQYLGILYRPEQLLFDSFATYLRVKLWSEYFAQRDTMTDWLTKKIKNSHSKHSHVFSSCPFPLKEGCSIKLVGSKQGSELFDGGILIDPKIHGTTRSSAVVYSFFNNDDEEITDPMNMDVLMRKDFCEFLRKRWPGMDVSFPIRLTTVSYPDGSFEQARLATLCIHLGSQSSIHQKLKHLDSKTPVDNSKKDAELSMKSESCQLFGDHALKMCMHPGSRSSPSVVSSEKDWEPVKTMDSFVTSTSSIGGMEESVFLERWMSTVSSGSQKSSSSAPCLPERDCGHMTECYSNSQSKYNEVEIKSRMRAEEKQQLGALYAHHIYEDLLLREAAFSASSLEPARKQQQFNNKTQKEKLIIIGREQRRSNKIQGKNILKSSFRGEEKKDEDGDSFVLPRPTRSTKSKKVRFLTAKKEHPNRYNILGVFQTHRKKSAKGQRTPGRKTT